MASHQMRLRQRAEQAEAEIARLRAILERCEPWLSDGDYGEDLELTSLLRDVRQAAAARAEEGE